MNKYYKPEDQIKDYSIIKIVGEGRYGIVYLAKNKQLEKCIIKQLKKEMLEETREKLFYEQTLLKDLDSSRFPKFIETFQEEDTEGYVLEYIEGKVFEDILMREHYKFKREEIYKIAFGILEIIETLQANNIVHRDIRPPNVIVKENEDLVLIDFGLARYIDNKRYVRQMDYWYMGDFLIHLYYTSYYIDRQKEEKPWYEELDLKKEECVFLKQLMGIGGRYKSIGAIRRDLKKLESML